MPHPPHKIFPTEGLHDFTPPPRKIIIDDNESRQNNAAAFEQLLSDIAASASKTVRDAGTKFETLIRDWLINEPTYQDRFSSIQTWKDWANTHPECTANAKDTGIDLVGTLADGSGFAAIQCKFYAKEATVPKAGIDSFLATADARRFKERFLIATNDHWTDNAQETLRTAFPPVTLIKRSDLAASLVDWNSYRKGQVALRARRTPRDYQKDAIQAVVKGFEIADRGKLIMACGTGKTYTSLKIAEAMAGKGGLVLFLVPSLSLLSQTLTDWKQQCLVPIHAFAVCSDTKTGKANAEDIDDLTTASELVIPATTEADGLADSVHKTLEKKDGMTVIFSTYHSMDVIHDAQCLSNAAPLPAIDFVVCDEAHRTSGGFFKDEADKPFTRIHKNDFIRANKRLYMTATPKIYGPKVKEQQNAGDIELYSMDDEAVYGKTFHEISFTQAVQQYQCLVDYKVIVLTVNEDLVKDAYSYADVKEGGLSVSNAAKVIGCWRALSKMDLKEDISMGDDKEPMRRAVGFAQVIHPSDNYDRTSSMAFAQRFDEIVTNFKKSEKERLKKLGEFNEERFDIKNRLTCETRHIDGSMNAVEKTELLDWLRADPKKDTCKILFNVRCLSEGVDVPALDAVLFLSPRKSMVDVVQTVGRVMRRSPDNKKKRGYVIIPIVTPSGVSPDLVLDQNKDFDTVWQVLRALKSIDSNFGSIVDGQLGKIDESKMEVICLSDTEVAKRGKRKPKDDNVTVSRRKGTDNQTRKRKEEDNKNAQLSFDFGRNEIMENELKARIVKKVGNRREWEDWAEDVGDICREQIKHIKKVLKTSQESMKAFDGFRTELKQTLNGELSDDEIIEMLGQHVVTKPILDALFADYPFTAKNPIARAMTGMVEKLDKEGLTKANHLLEGFYQSVQIRMRNVKTAEERQTVIKELFEKFFKFAFPKQQEKLGIVYTPVEIVDFINQSVADVLKNEFHTSIDAEGIHVLDPFTGTGTFIARLMQSGLIAKDKLPAKFKKNEHYEKLDRRLAETYVARTDSTLKGKLYDSYIRAYRWASDRIGERGIIGFVTNAGWLDSNSADGMRKCMAEEFSSIYIWHLKGNARTSGEQRQKEKDNVFGQGSRAPVAVVILVKNPEHHGSCQIHFASVDDYLTREEKLLQTSKAKSVYNLPMQIITPDAHGDWLNQREDSFSHFMRIDGKKVKEFSIFSNFSLGVVTSRDSWVYNSSTQTLADAVKRTIRSYNAQVQLATENSNFVIDLDPKKLKWDRPQKRDIVKGKKCLPFDNSHIYVSAYRPFFSQKLYFDRYWNNCVYQLPQLFPTNKTRNLAICVTGIGAKIFSCLIVDQIPCLDFVEKSQCFPRYLYTKVQKKLAATDHTTGELFEDLPSATTPTLDITVDDYERQDAITPEALQHFREVYPGETVTTDDLFYYIYGILHSEGYRRRYANNLMKELPRIPRVATYVEFQKFAEAGRKLADLHINFEKVPEYKGVQIHEDRRDGFSYYVTQMKYGKIPGKTGNAAKDKTKLVYNEFITVDGIPLEAQEYVVNKKSALDWTVERACVKTDKDSGIVNDFNDYAAEKKDPRYPLSLFLRIITVSLETMKIVKALPPLQIHPADM